MEVGYETHGAYMKNITFKNITVLNDCYGDNMLLKMKEYGFVMLVRATDRFKNIMNNFENFFNMSPAGDMNYVTDINKMMTDMNNCFTSAIDNKT